MISISRPFLSPWLVAAESWRDVDDDPDTSNERVRDEFGGERCFEARYMRSIIPRSYLGLGDC